MTEPRPLLSFAAPGAGSIPSAGPRGRSQPHGPSAARQGARLTPQFNALQDALKAGRATVTSTATDPDPELVVVFDLAGSADTFARAVREVPGLEFLAEFEGDEASPDDDFYMEDKDGRTNKAVPESFI